MSLIVLYFLHSTSVLSFYIDVVLTLSIYLWLVQCLDYITSLKFLTTSMLSITVLWSFEKSLHGQKFFTGIMPVGRRVTIWTLKQNGRKVCFREQYVAFGVPTKIRFICINQIYSKFGSMFLLIYFSKHDLFWKKQNFESITNDKIPFLEKHVRAQIVTWRLMVNFAWCQ